MTDPAPAVLAAVISCTDRAIPTPRQAQEGEMSEPITDQEWARCFLSRVHGREIHGGIRVDELAGKLADVRENALSRPVPVSGVQGHAEVPFPRSATATEGARAITASGTEAQ